jgi:hypothetical protein
MLYRATSRFLYWALCATETWQYLLRWGPLFPVALANGQAPLRRANALRPSRQRKHASVSISALGQADAFPAHMRAGH